MGQRVCAALLVFVMGCGTILNSSTARVNLPPGVTLDGAQGSVLVSQQSSHIVMYPDGRQCLLEPHIGALYIIGDVVLFFLLGLLVDAATGNWKSLDSADCPGVLVN